MIQVPLAQLSAAVAHGATAGPSKRRFSVAEFSPSMFREEVKAPHDFAVIRSLTTVNVTYLLT